MFHLEDGVFLFSVDKYYKQNSNTEIEKQIERQYDYTHWGDCLSLSPKEGWESMDETFPYKNLEKGETYAFSIKLTKILPKKDITIDKIEKVYFVPNDSDGVVDFTFYTNPKYVKDGRYEFKYELVK